MADREVFVNKVTVPSSSGTITAKLVDSVSGYTKYNYFEIPISYDSANQRYYTTGITWQNIIDAYNRGDYIYGKYGNNIYVMTYYTHDDQETFLKLENFTTGQNSITTDGFTVEDLTSLVRHISEVSSGISEDINVRNTLNNTTKYYVTGTTSSSTNTGTQVFDNGIYATTTAGQLNAKTYKVDEKVTLQWNSTDSSLDFIFV